MRFVRNEKGITLINLIITIIIILILTGVSLSGTLGNGSIINRAQEAIYKSDVKDLKDLWESKIADIDASNLNFDSLEEVLGEDQIPEDLRGIFAVENGKLVYKDDTITKEQEKWMNEVGIYAMYVNPIEIEILASVKTVTQTQVTTSKPVDVVVVIDASTSMEDSASDGNARYKNLIPAVNSVMDVILSANEKNRVAVVQFAKDSTTLLPLGHYSVPEGEEYFSLNTGKGSSGVGKFNSSISGTTNYNLKAGTGIMLGIARAEYIFQQRTETEKKDRSDFIILLSDGAPNYIRFDATYSMVSALKDASGTGSFNMSDTYIYANKEKSLNSAYHTIKWMETIKSNHEGLKFYTINFSEDTLSEMVMNPTSENITALLNSSKNYVIADDYKNTTYYNNEDAYKELIKTVSPYAEASYSGEFSETDLKNIFTTISESILESTNSETSLETVEKSTTLVINDKMEYTDENGNPITYALDTTGNVTVRVTASVFVPTDKYDDEGNIIREADSSRSNTYEKVYTVTEVMNGADPSLSMSGGSIVWNVSSDFSAKTTSNVRGLALQALENLYTYNEDANEAIDISKVQIVVPVYIEE